VDDDDDCALFSHFVVRAELAETQIPMDPSEVFTIIRLVLRVYAHLVQLTDARGFFQTPTASLALHSL